jgi:hypothetical protein
MVRQVDQQIGDSLFEVDALHLLQRVVA